MGADRAAMGRQRRPAAAVLAAIAATVTLAGCGPGASPAADVGITEDGLLRMLATDDLRFEPETVTVPAGALTIELICADAVNHNLVIDATGEEVVACTPGRTATGTVELAAGTHPVRCTVPGHEATMRAEIVAE